MYNARKENTSTVNTTSSCNKPDEVPEYGGGEHDDNNYEYSLEEGSDVEPDFHVPNQSSVTKDGVNVVDASVEFMIGRQKP